MMTYSVSIYSNSNNYTSWWKNFRHALIDNYSFHPIDAINNELRKHNCTKRIIWLDFETEEDFLIFKLKFS